MINNTNFLKLGTTVLLESVMNLLVFDVNEVIRFWWSHLQEFQLNMKMTQPGSSVG